MPTYIAICLVLPILLFFPVQFSIQTVNEHNITQFQSIVESGKEQAKQDGYFTQINIDEMKTEIKETFKNVNESEISINVTATPKYRTDEFDQRELITYKVEVPIEKVIAAGKMFGISDEDNKKMYSVSGTIASEKLQEEAP